MTTSPCTSCADLHTPCPCPAFLRWDAATHPAADPAPCTVCLDAELLLLAGEDLATTAPRICVRGGRTHRCGPGQGCRPMQPDSLWAHLRRHHRDDLLPRRTA